MFLFFVEFEYAFLCFLEKGKGMICGSKFNSQQITEIAPWSSAVTRLASVFVCVCWLGQNSWAGSDRISLWSPQFQTLCSGGPCLKQGMEIP